MCAAAKRTIWMNKRNLLAYVAAAAIALPGLLACGGKPSELTADAEEVPSLVFTPTKACTLRVFVENSGSMDGYMCLGAEFKDALKWYVSALEPHFRAVELYYINSSIIPCPGNLKAFIAGLTPESFRQAGGNRANTDIGQLFEAVVGEASDSVVCLFVSDCILDVGGSSANHFFQKQIDVTNAVRNFVGAGDNAVQVLRLVSRFQGTYYAQDGNTQLDAQRPYYLWAFGSAGQMVQMNQLSPPSGILHGIAGQALFSKRRQVPCQVLSKFGGVAKGVHPTKEGDFELVVRADFSQLPLPEATLAQLAEGWEGVRTDVQVTAVKPLPPGSGFTHALTLTVPNKKGLWTVRICPVYTNDVPDWVEAANDDSGTDIANHLNQTTGIKYILAGVAEAYKQETPLASVEFNVEIK